MRQAIDAYRIEGIETTLAFGRFVVDHEAFISGRFDTHFVKQHYSPEAIVAAASAEERIAALAAARFYEQALAKLRLPQPTNA